MASVSSLLDKGVHPSEMTTDWKREYEVRGALFVHDGKPVRPHPILTSKRHANAFFNGQLVMEDSLTLHLAAYDAVKRLRVAGLDTNRVDRTVAPAMGGITWGDCLAYFLSFRNANAGGYRTRANCLSAYTEKDGGERMVFNKTRVMPGEYVLVGEDVITTGGSTLRTIRAVEERGGLVMDFIAAIVNRSGLKEIEGRKIVALIDQPMPDWRPDDCPLCKQGSKAISEVKKPENWALLTAEYPDPAA